MKHFDIVRCIKAGDGFAYGEDYAMLGWNNGLHVVRENESGDVAECIVHNFGNLLQEPSQEGPDFVFLNDFEKGAKKAMTEITISLDQYNLLFEKAMSFDKICDAVKANIDKSDLYPVKDDDVLLLTGLTRYQRERIQAMANSAETKMIASMQETIDIQKRQIDALLMEIEQLQPDPEAAQPEEEESHAEDQAEH